MTAALDRVLSARSILVCCGPGGVGKTTTAAALALAGAMSGQRACVVTIDPARRLADALGVSVLTNSPQAVDGDFSGSLFALALDAASTFDALVDENAGDIAQAERIKANRLYRNLASTLSGTQEYMATEKLYELHESGEYDLIVVDTPPSRHALDFLEAPSRLAGFLDNKVFRVVTAPSRAPLKVLSVATQMLLRTVAHVAGSEIVEDTIAFFQAFEGMEKGFRDRAARVEALLRGDTTGFVLISTPRNDALEELSFVARSLKESLRSIDALVVNRVQPDFGEAFAVEPASASLVRHELTQNLADLAFVSGHERELINNLSDELMPSTLVEVPLFAFDVTDLFGLSILVRHLLSGEVPFGDGESPDR